MAVGQTDTTTYKQTYKTKHNTRKVYISWGSTKTLNLRKLKKNRCSGAWINGFSSFGAWNFTGCLYFTYGYGKRCMHHPKKQKKYVLLKKHPKKLSGKSAALFSFAIFVVSSKVRIKSHTSFEELLMSVLSRCQRI